MKLTRNHLTAAWAQEVLVGLGEPHCPAEHPYYDYLRLEAGPEWNAEHDTHLATLSTEGTEELRYELEQLIIGRLDGEYGPEVLREWSPAIRVKDWLAALEDLYCTGWITHHRKVALGLWAGGLMHRSLDGVGP